ncbi:MAG TPA: agmatinase [Acidimicrobiales bacterium]|nr:agmatinase [Acidimicrobiales bacterium]
MFMTAGTPPEPTGSGPPLPRFAGLATFARLAERRAGPAGSGTVAVLGVPFDSGTSYRPGARFGPAAVRAASRLLRPYHPELGVDVAAEGAVVDAGDVGCTPYDISAALGQIEGAAAELLAAGWRIVAVGGDHTVTLPLLRATSRARGPLALVHFDAHLDTWDSYAGARYTHGTPFRRASEEGLLLAGRAVHVGIRGPLYGPQDLPDDDAMGFARVSALDVMTRGVDEVAAVLRRRVGEAPVYVSVDIDVLDPAHAPGTGTPEAGGLSSRELLALLRSLDGADLVGADVVEVSPPYDHAEVTAIAAAHVAYELACLLHRRAQHGAEAGSGAARPAGRSSGGSGPATG